MTETATDTKLAKDDILIALKAEQWDMIEEALRAVNRNIILTLRNDHMPYQVMKPMTEQGRAFEKLAAQINEWVYKAQNPE